MSDDLFLLLNHKISIRFPYLTIESVRFTEVKQINKIHIKTYGYNHNLSTNKRTEITVITQDRKKPFFTKQCGAAHQPKNETGGQRAGK